MNAGLMVVPVKSGTEMACLCCGCLPTGERVGIAFTSEACLAGVMGPAQPFVRLSEHAMREMLTPLGVARIQVDPGFVRVSRPLSVPA
jgi:hypothetical protein